eukprot:g48433.t1
MPGVDTLHVQPHNHGTLMAASNMGICKPHRFFPQTEMNKFHGKTMKFRDKPTQERMTRSRTSSIVVVEHDTAPTRNIARPLPPIPALERIARAEDTPVVLRSRNRPPSRSSVRRIRFVDAKHVPPPKPKAPRDIDGNVDERNIVRGKRDRKQTPANTSKHTYRLAVAEDDDTQFVSQTDTSDGLRYEDVCLFTRVLRKPEKQLRVIPQVVEARRKEIQGLYDARCLEWATWQDAERDRVKPIRTGFVDAIKEGEATGDKKYKSRQEDDGTTILRAFCEA